MSRGIQGIDGRRPAQALEVKDRFMAWSNEPYERMAICPDTCWPDLMPKATFEWNPKKDWENQQKHGISFAKAQFAFADP